MALSNFIPSNVMNEFILSKLRKQLVAVDVVSTDYQSLVSKMGDTYKIPTLTTSAGAGNYTRNSTVTYSVVQDASQVLSIDQAKYFAYSIDFVDSKQAAINIANETAAQAAQDLKQAADEYLLQTVFEATTTSGGSGSRNLGVSGTPVTIYNCMAGCGTSAQTVEAINYLGRMAMRLDEQDVPSEDRFAIVPAWFGSYLVQSKVLLAQNLDANEAFTNGKIGRCYGFDIRISNNVRNYNAANSYIFAGHKSAVQFAGQLERLDMFEMETMFADAIRGLYVYGAKLVRPEALAIGVISQG